MFAVVVFAAVVSIVVAEEEKYTTKFDDVDIDQIVKNDRLLNNYFQCLMDTGSCSPEGAELKKNLPEALKNACDKCNKKQKVMMKKWIKYMIENKRTLYDQLEAKYDPEGLYRTKYKAEATKLGIKF